MKKNKIYYSPQAVFVVLNTGETVLQTSVKVLKPHYDDVIDDEWED